MTIYGWDLSHYDGPDSRAAIGEGFAFFTHKAGGDVDDTEIGKWWSLMRPYRDTVLLGAYWVLYPGDPAGRADAFLGRIDSQCPGWRDYPFILQVDCEKWGGDQATVPPKEDIRAFCDRLSAKLPKLRPIVYAPEWVYGDSLAGLGYPLWASAYVPGAGAASSLYPGDSSSRWDAYSGQDPVLLQFTSSATIAGQTTCDANAYRGTLAQLTALVAPGWEQGMALSKDDVATIANTDNVFKAPPGAVNADGSVNTHWSLASYVYYTYKDAHAVASALAALTAKVDTLMARSPVDVDEIALAAALAPLLHGVDEAQIAEALRTVLRSV